jgi:HEAT repeat protein
MKGIILYLTLAAAGLAAAPAPFEADAQARVEGNADRSYESGSRALDQRRWDEAIKSFAAVPRGSSRSDGALYWTAYAQNKAGRRSEALASLAELTRTYPQSRWTSDGKALEIEIRQAGGQAVSPDAQSDDELKLLALNALMRADPEKAVPVLEKMLQGPGSPRLKERALFVLLQSGSPRAREIVAGFAHGGANPDLQRKAIQFLGVFGGAQSRDELAGMYSQAPDASVKREILAALFVGHATDKIAAIARSEKDPDLRVHAIGLLGPSGGTAAELTAIYANDSDKRVRKAVLGALFVQGKAAPLIEIARKETDLELKKEAVNMLSIMKSKEATDFMMELLNK